MRDGVNDSTHVNLSAPVAGIMVECQLTLIVIFLENVDECCQCGERPSDAKKAVFIKGSVEGTVNLRAQELTMNSMQLEIKQAYDSIYCQCHLT